MKLYTRQDLRELWRNLLYPIIFVAGMFVRWPYVVVRTNPVLSTAAILNHLALIADAVTKDWGAFGVGVLFYLVLTAVMGAKWLKKNWAKINGQ